MINGKSPRQNRHHHMVYDGSKEFTQQAQTNRASLSKDKTKVMLNLSKNGLSLNKKNLTPTAINLIQTQLDKAKEQLNSNS